MKTCMKNNNTKYPKLGITSDNMIVLFSKPSQGMVIHEGKQDICLLSEFSKEWDEGCFENYNGQVIINEC